MELFNFTKLYGRVIRISFAKDRAFLSRPQRNNNNNLYVKNLGMLPLLHTVANLL